MFRLRCLGLLSLACAQNLSQHPNWPGPGQFFVGTCYQHIDSAIAPVLGHVLELAGIRSGPSTPDGVYARIVEGRAQAAGTRDWRYAP